MSILVAGVGNVLLGDDGFGVAIANRLARQPLPAGVEVTDFGIRGLHLAYRLLEPTSLLLVADVVRRGGPPGTLYVIEPEPCSGHAPAPDGHAFDLHAVLAAVAELGGALPRVRIVGCEASALEEGIGLSAPVEAAVGPAVRMIRDLIAREHSQQAALAAVEGNP
jgi:hydrogenase maturation protease